MIEALQDLPDNVLGFVCHGRVSREDYEQVLIPRVNRALAEHEKLRLYYETDEDFSGIEPGAVWEDTKIGLGHLSRWERFAVVTDVDWIRHTFHLFGFLVPGELRVFSRDEAERARAWIVA